MANEPTLSEITSIRPDSSVATGTPSPVYDTKNLVDTISRASQYKAENDWKKYNHFVDNLKETYKDLGEIQKQEVATQDREYLREQAANVYKDLLEDPKKMYSPELQDKLGKLRAETVESKQNKLFDWAHREYLNRNPELNNDENKSTIETFWKQPLGKRNPYSLNLPMIFDINNFSKGLRETVKSPFAESSVTPDGQFIKEKTGNNYNRGQFMQRWMSGLNVEDDKYGRPITGWVKQQYNQLPNDLKKQFPTEADYWKRLGEISFGSDKDITEITKEDLQANPQYLAKEKLAVDRGGLAVKWANYGLAKERLDKADNDDLVGAETVLNEATSIIKNGVATPVFNKSTGKTEDRLRVSDPNLLQKFGNIDKDGKTTNVPDAIDYNKDKDQITLIYYKPQVYGQKGGRNIDKEVPIDQRTWLKEITKRSFPNKDIGTINTLIEDVLTKSGNSLYKLTEKVETSAPQSVKPETAKHKADMNGTLIYSDDGKTWFDSKGNKVQ